MTEGTFRQLALALPETSESSHMDHPDFRVGGKIFATLQYPGKGLGMVTLTPEQQEEFIAVAPLTFAPVNGGWGKRGATSVHLRQAARSVVSDALSRAWRNVAPKRLVRQFDADGHASHR